MNNLTDEGLGQEMRLLGSISNYVVGKVRMEFIRRNINGGHRRIYVASPWHMQIRKQYNLTATLTHDLMLLLVGI
jgi:hypothetical protein